PALRVQSPRPDHAAPGSRHGLSLRGLVRSRGRPGRRLRAPAARRHARRSHALHPRRRSRTSLDLGRRHSRRLAPAPEQRPVLPRRHVGPRLGRRLRRTRWPPMAPVLKHLALLVHDIRRARRFYETYFGFDVSSTWHGEVLFVRSDDGFDLALMKGEPPPNPGAFHHFGFQVPSADEVHKLHNKLLVDGIAIVEFVDEPDLLSFKCVDPDGYTVEVYSNL